MLRKTTRIQLLPWSAFFRDSGQAQNVDVQLDVLHLPMAPCLNCIGPLVIIIIQWRLPSCTPPYNLISD